ncbi:hypothetical protein EXIGLDRAFT_774770 [Exidia glandulosa HHB12029]|uniref:Uncharacterized protein n=1 Tax=Exidia glandulosa HHB12029 TaxID=1314781 RepID=A0A165E8D4_EXIGL|nr:hypothetical protein EXIGLDRAFT_774770 [Exidia glandulosa HHB12029]
MIFTIFKVVQLLKYRSSSTTLIRVIHKDGILYFVAVTAVSVAYPLGEFLSNIAADITMLVGMQYCLYSFMACRTILNLRAAAANTGYRGQATWTSPSLHFAAARRNAGEIESNLGAPEDKTTAWFGHGLSAEPVSPSSVLVIGPE